MNLQDWAAVATIAGAVVSAGTLWFARWVAVTQLPKELEHFRVTKLEEKRSDVAERLWTATRRYVAALRELMDDEGACRYPRFDEANRHRWDEEWESDLFAKAYKQELRRLEDAIPEIGHALSMAEIYLGDAARSPVEDLYRFRSVVERRHLALLRLVQDELWLVDRTKEQQMAKTREEEVAESDHFIWLFKGAGLKELAERTEHVRVVLLPVARLGLPAMPPLTIVAAESSASAKKPKLIA